MVLATPLGWHCAELRSHHFLLLCEAKFGDVLRELPPTEAGELRGLFAVNQLLCVNAGAPGFNRQLLGRTHDTVVAGHGRMFSLSGRAKVGNPESL